LKKAVFGLGNPQDRYAHTRHNIGASAVSEFVRRHHPKSAFKEEGFSLVCAADHHLLVLPQTYMNLSGVAVGDIASHYHLAPENCLIVYDDVAIPFGHLRIRRSGRAGGQNGMRSVIEHLQSQDIPRLRIGIGPTEPGNQGDLSEYVLTRFDAEEQARLPALLKQATACISCFLEHGVESAMNRFNGEAISD